jgi:hypothetical protein
LLLALLGLVFLGHPVTLSRTAIIDKHGREPADGDRGPARERAAREPPWQMHSILGLVGAFP